MYYFYTLRDDNKYVSPHGWNATRYFLSAPSAHKNTSRRSITRFCTTPSDLISSDKEIPKYFIKKVYYMIVYIIKPLFSSKSGLILNFNKLI